MSEIPVSQRLSKEDILPHIPEKEIKSISEVNKGMGRRVYLVETEKTKYIAKRSRTDAEEMIYDIRIYPVLSKLKIPAPEMVYASEALIIEKFIPGRDLKENDPPEVYKEIGEALRKMHSYKTKGFGLMDSNQVGRWPDEKTNLPFIINPEDKHFKAPIFKDINIKKIIDDNIDAFDSKKSVLLHGDLHADNILVEGGKLQSFVDFADVVSGPPEVDLGLFYFEFADEKLWDAFLEGYQLDFDEKKFKLYAFFYGAYGLGFRFPENSPRHEKFKKIYEEVKSFTK